jgi:hypothetical protein
MISSTLAILEPTTLPMEISGEPANAACNETRSSGVDVPNPTITMPTIILDIRRRPAMATLPRTSPSPPANSRIKPAATKTPSHNTIHAPWS